MSKPIISVSGLRGIVGESLDPILASRYALAFAETLNSDGRDGAVLIGRDGRETGSMFADAIAAALMSAGFNVLYADVCATPTVGVLVRALNCSGGIQISASHNPPEYNGMKLFGADGRVISANEGQAVIDLYEKNQFSFVPYSKIGTRASVVDTTSVHLKSVLATVDVEAIKKRRLKVVLDSNRGAGSLLAKPLFEALDCQFEILGDSPDGQFEHVPEPTAENLKGVAARAKDFGADVVFCQDPDADRLAIIDEEGNYIGEEYTLAITLRHALSQSEEKGNVVINCATSRMSVDIAEEFGCKCIISAVGEANVTNEMIANDALYGGEGNGGPIDPRVGYVRDSFVAMAQTMDAMVKADMAISKLAAAIPSYEIVKDKIQLDKEKVSAAFDVLEKHFSDARPNRMDGLRLDFADSWLLIRASNTEPIVRVIAEAKTSAAAMALVETSKDMIANLG